MTAVPAESAAPSAAELVALLDSLPPWTDRADFAPDEWERFRAAAKVFRRADPTAVETALDEFVRQTRDRDYQGYEDESKPFILMRVLFDLPDRADARERQSFKGWINWPSPDADGTLNPGWPVRWSGDRAALEAPYVGSMGLPYAAAEEYRRLRERYPFRRLDG